MNGATPQGASIKPSSVGTTPTPAVIPPAQLNHLPPMSRTNSQGHVHASQVNGTHSKGKKKNDAPVDPVAMYESLKNRIAALEEEEVLEEEEERRFGEFATLLPCSHSAFILFDLAEEAQTSVTGMEENAIHAKYIELVCFFFGFKYYVLSANLTYTQFAEFKRMERDHAKEKQKLIKDKDAGLHLPLPVSV
jgi:hypothetical protein